MESSLLEEMEVVKFHNVTKKFGETIALDNASFYVRSHTIHALLGHNGAGKTTSLRLIIGLLRPNAGWIKVFGVDPYRRPEVRMYIGYSGESEGLYRGLNVYINLLRFCRVKLKSKSLCEDEINRITDHFELHDILAKKVNELSAGNRQRVVLARAFIGAPKLIILDEPLNKLDPVWRASIKKFLRDYISRNNATVLYSTHILSDVEEVSEYVTILKKGKVVYHGPLSNLLSTSNIITIKIVSKDKRDVKLISQAFSKSIDRIAGDRIYLSLDDMNDVYRLLSYVAMHRIDIDLLEVKKSSLENIYLEYYMGEDEGVEDR